MAMPVSVTKPIVGVDVAKNELVISHRRLYLQEHLRTDMTGTSVRPPWTSRPLVGSGYPMCAPC
ncbi:hypothetical protein J2W43_004483 [Pseudomonas brassicacearum]|uniref:Transposase n=1 Tax=Pseudomonas brassicacearum TaxID=930166 RepID=A0AAW8MFL0_9PSED|nr:hypothetical protein [Pseudomonas brassicacearum]